MTYVKLFEAAMGMGQAIRGLTECHAALRAAGRDDLAAPIETLLDELLVQFLALANVTGMVSEHSAEVLTPPGRE